MEKAASILQEYFGYSSFRPLQEEAITSVVGGKDTFLLMPTGGGKSICYQVPALLSDGITLVISPLISLMKDQVEGLKANGIEAAFFNSSLSRIEEDILIQECFDGKIKLLYISPERLLIALPHWIKDLKISMVAIDEAHCVSTWGHDFRPEYAQLTQIREYFPEIPFMALTATADKTTRKDIIKQLGLKEPQVFISSFDRPNLSLDVRPQVRKKDKIKEIVQFIQQRNGEPGIIYCLSRKGAEEMKQALNDNLISAEAYHAGLKSEKRSEVQEQFLKDEVTVICATIAFGMGIDKSNVRWVIHNNLPKNLESFYQEIGRSGRDGEEATTILYYNLSDLMILNQFIQDGELAEINRMKLRRMQEYAEATSCRRKLLLSYFNEYPEDDCGNCDICHNPPEFMDGTIIVQKALSGIKRTQEKVGTNMLINILRGSQNSELIHRRYHLIKTYAQGTEYSFDHWRQFITQMLNQGWIEIAYDESSVLKVTPEGEDILFGRKTARLTQPREKLVEKKTKKAAKKPSTPDEELFGLLRELRKELARKANMPPYIIFSDAALKDMSGKKPVTQNQMLEVSGVGMKKWQSYGPQFLSVIRDYLGESNQPAIEERNARETAIKESKTDTKIKTLNLFNQGLTVEEIAQRRDLKAMTLINHLAELYQNGEEVDITRLVDKKEIDQVADFMDNNRISGLKDIFTGLNEATPYHKIKLALLYIERQKSI